MIESKEDLKTFIDTLVSHKNKWPVMLSDLDDMIEKDVIHTQPKKPKTTLTIRCTPDELGSTIDSIKTADWSEIKITKTGQEIVITLEDVNPIEILSPK
jgi:hypothetical protein